jgi:hypothetical protein
MWWRTIPRSSLAGAWRLSRWDSVSSSRCGIFAPVEVRFKWTNTLPHENALFWVLGRRVHLGQAAAFYCRVSTADQICARQEPDLRAFARKARQVRRAVLNVL